MNLTNRIHRCDINNSDDIWAKKIIECSNMINDRKINYKELEQFDLKQSVCYVEKIYRKIAEEEQ